MDYIIIKKKAQKHMHPIYIGILMVVVLILAFIFTSDLGRPEVPEHRQNGIHMPTEVEEVTEPELPPLQDRQNPVKEALKSNNIDYCEYVEDEVKKEACKKSVYDSRVFDQATSTFDIELCNDIENPSARDSCILIASSGAEYIEQEEPVRIALQYLNNHDIDNAIISIEKLIADGDKNVVLYQSLALAYAEKGLQEQEAGRSSEEYVQKSLKIIEDGKALFPSDSELLRVQGYVYEIKPDILKSLESYDESILLDQNNAAAYAGRGHAYRLAGMLDKSVDDFYKAAELDEQGNMIYVYVNLCNLEYSRGEVQAAVSNCEKAIAVEETTEVYFKSEAYNLLGLIYYESGDYAKAENHLLMAKGINPMDENVYITLAKVYNAQRDMAKAEEMANKALELVPTKAQGYEMLAYAHFLNEDFDSSIKAAQEGVSLVDSDVSLLESSKDVTKRNLYYIISDSYGELGDAVNQEKYLEMGQELGI